MFTDLARETRDPGREEGRLPGPVCTFGCTVSLPGHPDDGKDGEKSNIF